MFNQTF